jgi:hypothetical protein
VFGSQNKSFFVNYAGRGIQKSTAAGLCFCGNLAELPQNMPYIPWLAFVIYFKKAQIEQNSERAGHNPYLMIYSPLKLIPDA